MKPPGANVWLCPDCQRKVEIVGEPALVFCGECRGDKRLVSMHKVPPGPPTPPKPAGHRPVG